MTNQDARCVVLGRAERNAPWDFVMICLSPLNAWRFASSVEKQQHRLGDKTFQCIVVTEVDYDANKINAIRPPKGTDLALPEGVPEAPAPAVVVRPPPLAAKFVEAAPELEPDPYAFEMHTDLLGV